VLQLLVCRVDSSCKPAPAQRWGCLARRG
jgi:hypothetical protein